MLSLAKIVFFEFALVKNAEYVIKFRGLFESSKSLLEFRRKFYYIFSIFLNSPTSFETISNIFFTGRKSFENS